VSFMSSASSASELLIDSSDSVSMGAVSTGSTPTDSAEQQGIPAYLRQALQMLDLQPEAEVAKYRAYKEGKTATPTYEKLNPVLAAPEEEDEDYEEIPPSEPFAVMEHARAYSSNSDAEPAGKLVFKDSEPPAASLDLSMLPPGEISSARNEYLPASQELWRSLGKPAAPAEIPVPKWKLPVAIGSALTAVAAVSGMTYVNLHPTLLQQVPVVAQLTAPPVMPAIPPGQNLAGPDLAMGEFTDLGLGNINAITLPNSNTQIAQAPVAAATTAPINTLPPTIQNPAQPTAPSAIQPPVATATSPIAPTGGTTRLSDTLVRNLLPPNIQQMAGRDVSQPSVIVPAPQSSIPQSSAPQSSVQTPAPYVPQTPNQPKNKKISDTDTATNTAPYQVMAKYVNPIGFEKIRTILPDATRAGDRIVLGNFSEKTPAKNLVKKLKQQGIEAWLKNS
jgi:hypothetical protein